jgi:hypothetical protein
VRCYNAVRSTRFHLLIELLEYADKKSFPHALEHYVSSPEVRTFMRGCFVAILLLVITAAVMCRNEGRVDPSKVVIVLSHGRSGSTEVCGIVSNLVGGRIYGELFGGTRDKMAAVPDPLELALRYLEAQQEAYPGKIVGFKWKPYHHGPKYQKVWDWVAKRGVKVVYSYRNPLDVLISSSRSHEEDAVYNCKTGDDKCVDAQQALQTELNLDTVLESLERLKIEGISTIVHLSQNNVTYFDVTYEGLNHGSMEARLSYLQGLADFLRPGKTATKAAFKVGTEYIGHYHQNETVSNYAALVVKLKGTRFSRYLH